MTPIIRLLRSSEVETAAEIVGMNYNKRYADNSRQEFRCMFSDGWFRPTYLVAKVWWNGRRLALVSWVPRFVWFVQGVPIFGGHGLVEPRGGFAAVIADVGVVGSLVEFVPFFPQVG